MPSHVALLRGVNVGGRRVAMSDLREIVTSLGHGEVATYIQSGNVVFTAPDDKAGDGELARALEAALEARLGLRIPVVVLTRDELAGALEADPYPAEEDPRFVHLIFFDARLTEDDQARFSAAQAEVVAHGSRDEATALGRVLYLHTPDGFGTSELATLLTKSSKKLPLGTARNRATSRKLLDLLG